MKKALREQLLHLRAHLAPPLHGAEATLLGKAAAKRLVQHPAFVRARSVALYQAFGSEFDPAPIGAAARLLGAAVCAPRIFSRRPPTLAFHLVSEDPGCLQQGPLGIPEPRPDLPLCTRVDLFIVPGLGFDSKGHRLGYGRGYYDAALRAQPSALRVGACYPFQILPAIPHDEHDEPMDLIVTPCAVHETLCRRLPPHPSKEDA